MIIFHIYIYIYLKNAIIRKKSDYIDYTDKGQILKKFL